MWLVVVGGFSPAVASSSGFCWVIIASRWRHRWCFFFLSGIWQISICSRDGRSYTPSTYSEQTSCDEDLMANVAKKKLDHWLKNIPESRVEAKKSLKPFFFHSCALLWYTFLSTTAKNTSVSRCRTQTVWLLLEILKKNEPASENGPNICTRFSC